MNPGRERRLVTSALMLGMCLVALEARAVGTAMPTAVAELGGVACYSWAFSAYSMAAVAIVGVVAGLAFPRGSAQSHAHGPEPDGRPS